MDDDLVARSNARLGALLKGKYTLDRVLGIGGMATVYAATHRNGKEFAVKVLHADLSLRSDTRTRFLREGYLANRVSHPGAVAVLDDDVADDGGAFLVMELIHGETVDALWERHRLHLPLPLVAGIGLQLLDVLAAAHARALVHRDIKPGNLMLTHEGQLKVLDFGIARLRDMANVHATQTGMVMGTPAFMAPEHALAKTEEIDAQTDLWAVGATMFTLATGLLVHEAANTQQILVKAATLRARPLAEVMPSAPEELAAVIDKALAFEKADRWANATQMQTALREAARRAFDVVPTASVLSNLLDELGEHEKTSVLSPIAQPVPGREDHKLPDAAAAPDFEEVSDSGMPTARRAAAGALAGISPASVEPREGPPAIGLITAAAVATDSSLRRAVPKTRGAMAAAVILGAVGIAAVVFVATRAPQSQDEKTAASASRPIKEAASPSNSTNLGVSTVAPSAAWTALVPEAPPGPQLRSPSVPVSALATPRPPSRPSAPAGPVTATAAPRATPPAVSGPNKSGCNPPYEFDESGNKRWKRECL